MNVKLLVAALAALAALIAAAPAGAQDYQMLRRASLDIYDTCIEGPDGGNRESCACAAGFFGGALSEQEYDVAGRLARIGGMIARGATEDEINAEYQTFFNAGYTPADAQYVNSRVQSLIAKGNAVCAPYEDPALV